MVPDTTNTVIVIAGPTAVGKTAVSVQLAAALQTSIISADSRQCYRELDIAVAKPSAAQLASIPHYFISSHSIHDDVNAGVFEQYALQSAAEIFTRNNTAVMVGGTGLYINAFCDGIDAMPAIPEDVRTRIVEQYHQHGLTWLQQQVKEKDPAFWMIAEQQNPQRLMRALEFVLHTGESITGFRKGNKAERPFRIIKVALWMTKEKLLSNINIRVEEMAAAGLVKEAELLLPFRNLNALQTVGYEELFDYFDGHCTLESALDRIKIHTRQYAKRQMTMFKKKEDYTWINAEGRTAESIAGEIRGMV